jgi:hypothetical protein
MVDRRFRVAVLPLIIALFTALTSALPASARVGYDPAGIAPGRQTPIVFVDALKQSTPWLSASPLAEDGDGQVTSLRPGQTASRLVYAAGQSHPVGDYTLLYDGAGSFGFDGATIIAHGPGRAVVSVTSPTAPLVLHLGAVDLLDPARNIRLIVPGFEKSYGSQPFLPQYVRSLTGAETLRFAGWSNAQSDAQSSVWPLRPRVSRVTQAMLAGVAPEYEIALANATGADPWFVLPVGATDGYVYGIAALVHGLLDPRLHPIFEYGDRVWSDGSKENAYARMAARNVRLPGDASVAALEWYAMRSVQVFSVVDIAYGRDARDVAHVLSLPGANGAAAMRADRTILTFARAAQHAQMLVVAADDRASLENSIAIAASAGGPRQIWQMTSGGSLIGEGMAQRAPVAPRHDLPFAIGSDITPATDGSNRRPRSRPLGAFIAGHAALAPARLAAPLRAGAPNSASTDELTYHNDLFRTGWNPNESILNTTNVASSGFGHVFTLPVDGDVLAQPLYLHQYPLATGPRDIVLVVTEHDSVYEFDPHSYALINRVSLGTSQSSSDVGCEDIRPEYGITSTPVIDRALGRIYLVAATEPKPFVFYTKLHALDIATLKDQVPPVEIAASTVLSNGTLIKYIGQNQQNRTSLAESGGSVYVGIGSHCDNNPGNIVGWILRYDASLHQTAKFSTAEDTDSYLLSSVWMTGFAPAVDEKGDIFVVTGNGSFDADHTGGKNFGESVLRLPPDISTVTDYFAPANWSDLNNGDIDFGSGGVMLLPKQNAKDPFTAVAQGKFSTLYLLNRSHLGQVKPGDTGALQSIPNTGNGVWGGPAYYSGPSGQFVYSQSDSAPLLAFSVAINASGLPQLELSSTGSSTAGYGGSLPIVSSNGQQPGTAIVWLINRSTPLKLEAYDATDVSKMLFQQDAGSWSNPQNNGFLTPLVANGKVYVPSTNQVQVFGLIGSRSIVAPSSAAPSAGFERRLTGIIMRVAANTLTLRLRDGHRVDLDIAPARAARHLGVLPLGRAVTVYGWIDKAGTFHVASVGHTSQNPAVWSPDL